MKTTKIKILLTLVFLSVPLFITEVLAQAPPPAPSGNSVPINGLGILAALGIGYGIKKLRGKNK
ncbi:MAG TPA: hypothetical protein PLI16_09515 [Bacteroidales bacterium]|nr:hypothetical protein [Bacteroidales bacterium]HOH84836.1 hypothetical protein [Bacteroidales bacterium]